MIRDFSREELEPVAATTDTEFTLGVGTILGIGGALLLLCAVCFGLGYTLGRRASTDRDTATVLPASKASPMATASGAKPGAHGSAASTQTGDSAQTPGSASAATLAQQSASTGNDPGSTQPNAAADPRVKPALTTSTAPADAALHVQPATAQTQGWMVQIAAVSHSEDAEVLVSALRKRGYSVSARRELGDNLVHVQTGPFVNRNDANAMRQKLLNDGYNAVVQ